MVSQSKYYLKFLKDNRTPAYGGSGQWPEPGIWTEEVDPIPCEQGWHLCRKQDIFNWVHETLWVVEADGEPITDPNENNKVVARRARLVRQVEEWCPRNQRLFAADCAEHVLHHFESVHPDDDRPRKAIETARRYARGEATVQQLTAARSAAESAAESAAWSAAGSAVWSAAGFAADAVWYVVKSAASYATESAAWDAARSAAEFAARSAAESAERDWQIVHLFEFYLNLNPTDFH